MFSISNYRPPRRLKDPEEIEHYRSQTLAGKYDLDKSEQEWRDRSEFLQTRGYLLRPRFRKGWKPSWLNTDLHPRDCEDFHKLLSIRIIDATRISDGKRVVLKRVRRTTNEVGFAQSLHIGSRRQHPDNHCVPILEYFDDLEDRTLGFLVMPLLRPFDNPPFAFISEVVEFSRQMLIGLRFLHRNKVAHRDLSSLNIMMDGDVLYPTGFHPCYQFMNPVVTNFAEYLHRRDVPAVNYYIIDFGISTAFDDQGKKIEEFEVFRDSPEVPEVDDAAEQSEGEEIHLEPFEEFKARMQKLAPNANFEGIQPTQPRPIVRRELPPFTVLGRDALDREIPELSIEVPYDPFLVDIFTLGNVFKKNLLQKYSNLGFLSPLIDSMTQTDPKMRPSVEEAIQHFEHIVSGLKRVQLCLPLRSVEEPLGRYSAVIADAEATIREYWIIMKGGIKKLFFFSWLRRRARKLMNKSSLDNSSSSSPSASS